LCQQLRDEDKGGKNNLKTENRVRSNRRIGGRIGIVSDDCKDAWMIGKLGFTQDKSTALGIDSKICL
jgi:hypothetical protein